ncbi:MAG: polysaccharide deacetylase family protein [Hymenobacteraceae bacterium]|nr:polysaccharide deacetylase family protein [Hymenobacteraceae bacterium]
MKGRLLNKIKSLLEHKARVLMYHRVAEPASDAWEIAVSPANFEEQLRVLKATRRVVPLPQLLQEVKNGSLRSNSMVLTFDDGYLDNYTTAVPLLEQYGLPATFFITSGNIGSTQAFWWDELEYNLLFAVQLPSSICISINGVPVKEELGGEAFLSEDLRQQHSRWKACEEAPPTKRARLFYRIWEQLRPLPATAQQQELQKVRDWWGDKASPVPDCRSMSREQLQEIGKNPLFTIGAHTVSHPALAYHEAAYQEQELLRNQAYLQDATGSAADILAYPYGNYNEQTLALTASLGFSAALTTEARTVTRGSNLYRLGRFQVKNIGGAEFKQQLKHWLKKGD